MTFYLVAGFWAFYIFWSKVSKKAKKSQRLWFTRIPLQKVPVNYPQDHHIVLEPYFHIHYETHQEVRLLDSLGFLGLYLAYIFVVLLGRFIHNRNRVDQPYAGVLILFLSFFLPSTFVCALVDPILPSQIDKYCQSCDIWKCSFNLTNISFFMLGQRCLFAMASLQFTRMMRQTGRQQFKTR